MKIGAVAITGKAYLIYPEIGETQHTRILTNAGIK